MSEVRRKKGESFEGFMRRAKRQWQMSGKLLQVRKIQFRIKKKSKNLNRKNAVLRAKKFAQVEFLRKTGRLPKEEEQNTFKKAA